MIRSVLITLTLLLPVAHHAHLGFQLHINYFL